MARYDLFRVDSGSPSWIGTAETLEEAHAKASELQDCPECVVLDQTTGHKIVIRPGSPTAD
jgi:hypothetical protein